MNRSVLAWLALSSAALLLGCSEGTSGSDVVERWRVQHYKAPCTGEGAQLCYLVARGDGKVEYFYDQIEDFEYRWGSSYEILVTKVQRRAPADASTFQYRLASVVKQQRAPLDATFRLALLLDGKSVIQADNGACTLLGAITIDTSVHSCDALRQLDAAVFKHHALGPLLVPLIEPR